MHWNKIDHGIFPPVYCMTVNYLDDIYIFGLSTDRKELSWIMTYNEGNLIWDLIMRSLKEMNEFKEIMFSGDAPRNRICYPPAVVHDCQVLVVNELESEESSIYALTLRKLTPNFKINLQLGKGFTRAK